METLGEINKDGDGSIDEEEYMGVHRDHLYCTGVNLMGAVSTGCR